jgi:cell division protein FtsQ
MDIRKTKKSGSGRKWLMVTAIIITILVITGVGALAYEYFFIREINFYGNRHLSVEDLNALTGCSTSSRLFSISSGEIYRRLKKSPWIKEAIVRKDLAGRMDVHLTESVAIGILMSEDKSWLIDREGVRLEAIRQEPSYFLPVIRTDPSANGEAYQEAVTLAEILYDKKVMAQSGNIEISGTRPEDITMKADDLVVRVGAGEFVKKLDKLNFVKEEIARRNMKVEYVDLRFADKIVVKPSKHSGHGPDSEAESAVKQKKSTQRKRTGKGAGGRAKGNVS